MVGNGGGEGVVTGLAVPGAGEATAVGLGATGVGDSLAGGPPALLQPISSKHSANTAWAGLILMLLRRLLWRPGSDSKCGMLR